MTASVREKDALIPVVFWAPLGLLFLVTQIYVYGEWIASRDFRAVPPGPDPVPDVVRIAMLVYEVLSIAGLVGVLVWFVRGIRRSGGIDNVRLLMIGWLSAYWLDPWLNFLTPMFTYNAYGFNRGCWCNFMPGWQSPNGATYAEPLLVDAPSYFSTFTFTALASLAVIRLARTRWPKLGVMGMALAGYVGVWLTMGLLDIVATRYLGFDAWPGAFHQLSFWGGRYYQFPVYEFILFPTPFVACAFLLYYADGQGQTMIERGVDRLARRPGPRLALRALAFIAFCNVLNLSYTTAMGIHAVYIDSWPANVPSWLANGQCGGKTGISCPAK